LRKKLTGTQAVNNDTYFQAIIDNGIMLLPFTVDPFGGLGPHGHAFLYGTGSTTLSPAPPPLPPHWKDTLATAHAKLLLTQLEHMPAGLLPKAAKAQQAATAAAPTGVSPLNISTALAQHILRSLDNARATLPKQPSQPTTVLGPPLHTRTTTAFLDPLPLYMSPVGD
jgi:hypothetical protein